jgi:hypothetical protein
LATTLPRRQLSASGELHFWDFVIAFKALRITPTPIDLVSDDHRLA